MVSIDAARSLFHALDTPHSGSPRLYRVLHRLGATGLPDRDALLTPLEALNRYGVFRLGARRYDLIKQGWDVRTEIVKRNGKRFAEYSIPLPLGQLSLFQTKGPVEASPTGPLMQRLTDRKADVSTASQIVA